MYWDEGEGHMVIRYDSQNWCCPIENRIVKILHLNRRDEECKEDIWYKRQVHMDKCLMLLDAGGQCYHLDAWHWERAA